MTAIQTLDWSKGVPNLGGNDDQENLLIILGQLRDYRDEKVVGNLRERFIQHLTTCPMEKVEKAAVSLIGRKYTFKDGVTAYFRDSQVSTMMARSDQLRLHLERGDLNFPHLSKESFSFVVADFDPECEKHTLPSFRTKVEVYKTFGSSLNWHNDLADSLIRFISITLEEAIYCYKLIKDDPKVMERLKFQLKFEPFVMVELYKHIPELDWPLMLDGNKDYYQKLCSEASAVKSVKVDGIEVDQLKEIKDKHQVEIKECYLRFGEVSFKEDNPCLKNLSIVNSSHISPILAPSITSLSISHSLTTDDDWKEINKLKLMHLGLSNLSTIKGLPLGLMCKIVSKLDSLELSGAHYDLLQTCLPILTKLTLINFTNPFKLVDQPSVTFLSCHSYSGCDFLLKSFLPHFPKLHTLDISLGDAVVNNVTEVTFDVLNDSKVKHLIMRGRRWPHVPFWSKSVTEIEDIDVSLGDFFEGRFLKRRMEYLLACCPNLKRIIYSGHEKYNFPIEIESLKLAFKQIEFIER